MEHIANDVKRYFQGWEFILRQGSVGFNLHESTSGQRVAGFFLQVTFHCYSASVAAALFICIGVVIIAVALVMSHAMQHAKTGT